MSTLAQLTTDTLMLLNQASNSPVGNVESGTNATPTQDTATTILYWLNQAADDLAMSCYPIFGKGTVAAVSGTDAYSFSGLTVSGITAVWDARSVGYAGAALTQINRATLEVNFPSWAFDASGTPLYWSQNGAKEVLLYPSPNGTSAIQINGLACPTHLASGGDIPSWLPAQWHQLLAYYAAYNLARKQIDDPSLMARSAIWQQEYDIARTELWNLIDAGIRRQHYPLPPIVSESGLSRGNPSGPGQ